MTNSMKQGRLEEHKECSRALDMIMLFQCRVNIYDADTATYIHCPV